MRYDFIITKKEVKIIKRFFFVTVRRIKKGQLEPNKLLLAKEQPLI